jgi:ribosomal protein S18 acetylase RimI-like enzyme
MKIDVLRADYLNAQHADDISYLLSNYAEDPMGGGAPLSDHVKQNLAKALSKLPHALSVISYVNDKPAGLINCFESFSTFKCKPLINIHDIVVVNEFRGMGISQLMLSKVEDIAKVKGCCKITLEVLEGNEIARNSYLKFGFDGYELDPEMGKALFWQKTF